MTYLGTGKLELAKPIHYEAELHNEKLNRTGSFSITSNITWYAMNITVKLFATFRNGRFKIAQQERPEGTAGRAIMLELGLTEEEMGVVLVNGRHASLDQILHEGDTLSLFPLVGGG